MILVKNLKSPFCKLGQEIMFDDLVRKQVLLDYLNTNFANFYKLLSQSIDHSNIWPVSQAKSQSVSQSINEPASLSIYMYQPFNVLVSQFMNETASLSVNQPFKQIQSVNQSNNHAVCNLFQFIYFFLRNITKKFVKEVAIVLFFLQMPAHYSLTIIPLTLMASESIAHEAEKNFSQLKLDFNPFYRQKPALFATSGL